MIDSKWLLLFVIVVLFVGVLTLSCSIVSYRQRRRKPMKIAQQNPPVQPKTMFVPSSTSSAVSSHSPPLTNTDVVYLNKLFRTASDRTLWKDENVTVDRMDKPRKVPSNSINK